MVAYRLYRRDHVKSGSWYHAVNCKGCDKLIYALDDPTGGKAPVPITGEGLFSIPCLRCGHDDFYKTSEIKHVQSLEDIKGARPDRVAVDSSSRKPILRSYSSAKVTFGVGYVEDRPKAAAIIGRAITAWADIERECARLLSGLMGSGIPTAVAVFSSLRSSRAQHDALDAAAYVTLDASDYELFSAHMARKSALEKERNDLTHGCYGVSYAIPEGVVWVSQNDFTTFQANQTDQKALDHFRTKQFVYELGTLERIAQEIADLYDQMGLLIGYLSTRHDPTKKAFRAQQYLRLCSQPHIRQALDCLRTAKKAAQAQSRGKPSKPKGKR